MRQAREVSLQGERQRDELRRDKREYMRRWRANPENRAGIGDAGQTMREEKAAAIAGNRREDVLVLPDARGGKAD